MHSLVRALARLLRTWWSVDRIRASPAETRLLDLRPPCVVIIDGEAVEVLDRCLQQALDGPRIVYRCVRRGGPDRLSVILGDLESRPVVRWIGADGQRRNELPPSSRTARCTSS